MAWQGIEVVHVVQRRLFLKGLKSLLGVELGIPVGISRAPRDGNGEFFEYIVTGKQIGRAHV